MDDEIFDAYFIRSRDEKDDPERRDKDRARIASETAQFLTNGGQITDLDAGEGRNSPVPITRLRLWELNK